MNKDKLTMKWSKKEKDILVSYPDKRDGHLLVYYLASAIYDYKGQPEPSLIDELKDRGYDITTIKFSIERGQNDE